MIRKLYAYTFFFTTLAWGSELVPPEDKRVRFEVDYYGVWRGTLSNLDFLYSLSGNGTISNTVYPNIGYGYVSALRALMEINFGRHHSVEALYGGLMNWNSSGTTVLGNALQVATVPYTTFDWVQFSEFAYNYQSQWNSGELSYWNHVTPRYADIFSASWMIGLRYINLNDTLNMAINTGSRGDTGYVKATNQLWGGQLGASFDIAGTKWFFWGCQAKGGVYADVITKTSVFNDQGDTVVAVNATVNGLAADWTIELTPYIRLNFNPCYIEVAYDGIILFNPVLAPSQVKLSKSVNKIYTHKCISYNSFYAGFGFSW